MRGQFLFSAEAASSGEEEIEFSDGGDLLDVFDNSEDSKVEESQPAFDTKPTASITVEDTVFSIKFSDHLDTEIGGGYQWKQLTWNSRTGTYADGSGATYTEYYIAGTTKGFFGYLDFTNKLYMTARSGDDVSVRITLTTEFPTWTVGLSEIYMDYVAFSHLYITAGKKQTTWGYTRLFSNTDYYGDGSNDLSKPNTDKDSSSDYLPKVQTNIVSDSDDTSSVLFRVPFRSGMFSFLAMLPDESASTSPSPSDMTYATSLEYTLFQTTVNLFCRFYPSTVGGSEITVANKLYNSSSALEPVYGIEAKRTVFGTDIYFQAQARTKDSSQILEPFNEICAFHRPKNADLVGYENFVVTGGFYKFWNSGVPVGGINVEGQGVYMPNNEKFRNRFINRIAVMAMIGKLGPSKNISFAAEWHHNFTNYCYDVPTDNYYIDGYKGMIKAGVILTNIFPHAQWRNGIQVDYGRMGINEDSNAYWNNRFIFVSTIKLSVDF